MYETLKTCPSCQHSEFSNEIICTDHLVTDESFVIVKCQNCGLLFTNPRPTVENIGKYYDSPEYASHNQKSKGLIDVIYKVARGFALKRKLSLINKLQPQKGKLLDVGSGTGDFLKTCEDNGWNVTGIEFNRAANQASTEKVNGTVFASLDELQLKKEFNVITLWHVLEHLHELRESLKKFRKVLKKNGALIIAVPNMDSWDSQHYKEKWAAYDVPRHLYHFNQLTFKKLAQECKFSIRETKPMKLDAYYVSLLSEKNMHGKNRFYRAFMSGLKSNRWAKENQGNYSSLIYILSKK